jgi:hypothetical protein
MAEMKVADNCFQSNADKTDELTGRALCVIGVHRRLSAAKKDLR